MRHLPPRLVGATPATFARFRRVGDAASDLNSAGQALLSDLQTNGCQQSAQSSVSAFQTAWNAAWTANVLGPPMPGPLTVDGLYGANTSQALGAWMTSQGQDGTTVPAGCVASSSGSSSGTTVTTTAPNGTTTTTQSSLPLTIQQNLTAPWNGLPVWAWLAGAGVLGLALYETRARPVGVFKPVRHKRRRMGGHRRRMRRGRRRNPVRAATYARSAHGASVVRRSGRYYFKPSPGSKGRVISKAKADEYRDMWGTRRSYRN